MRRMLGLCGAGSGAVFLVCAAAAGATASSAATASLYSHAAARKLYYKGKYDAVESMCQDAIAAIEARDGDQSWLLADPLNDLAGVDLRMGRFKAAEKLIQQAEPLLDPGKREQALVLARVYTNKAWRHYGWGESAQGEKWLKAAQDTLQKNGAGTSLDMAEVLNNMGLILDDGGPDEVKQAELLLFRSWEMRRKLAGDESAEVAESLNNMGMHFLFHPGDSPQENRTTAIATLRKAAELAAKVYGKDNSEAAFAQANLALAYMMVGQIDLADKTIHAALPITEAAFGKLNLDRAFELDVLGEVLETEQKYQDAEQAFKESVSINEAIYGPNHEYVGSALTYLEGLYDAMGDQKKKEAVEQRIAKLRGTDL